MNRNHRRKVDPGPLLILEAWHKHRLTRTRVKRCLGPRRSTWGSGLSCAPGPQAGEPRPRSLFWHRPTASL